MVEERIIDGAVGPQTRADGNLAPIRAGMTGEMITGNAHGFYSEQSSRGGIFCASTGVAGVAPGTALSTTPPMVIWNPVGSGKVLSILRVGFGFISGTLGAGALEYAYVPGQVAAPTTGTELTVQSNRIGAKGACVGRAFQGSTVVATPTALKPGIILTALTTSTATNPAPAFDQIDGMITVPEGVAFVVQGVAGAGTSPLGQISVEWEELPKPTAQA